MAEFVTVKWEGTAGIEQAHKLRDELIEAFKKNKKILLDISQVEDIDITGIQIIVAARKEAEKTGKSFFISDKISDSIKEFISASLINLNDYILGAEISEGQ